MGQGSFCCLGTVTICQNKCKWPRDFFQLWDSVHLHLFGYLRRDCVNWRFAARQMDHSSNYEKLSGLSVTIKSRKSQKSRWVRELKNCPVWTLTARQLREFALPAQLTGLLSRLLAGNCPGSKLVWRGICPIACDWFCNRGAMMQVIRCLWFISLYHPVKVRFCKYRDKQITTTDRVSACWWLSRF